MILLLTEVQKILKMLVSNLSPWNQPYQQLKDFETFFCKVISLLHSDLVSQWCAHHMSMSGMSSVYRTSVINAEYARETIIDRRYHFISSCLVKALLSCNFAIKMENSAGANNFKFQSYSNLTKRWICHPTKSCKRAEIDYQEVRFSESKFCWFYYQSKMFIRS